MAVTTSWTKQAIEPSSTWTETTASVSTAWTEQSIAPASSWSEDLSSVSDWSETIGIFSLWEDGNMMWEDINIMWEDL